MLTQIDVDSENAFLVPILGVTPKDSLLVRSVTGLSAPDITLFIGDYARDGGFYQGRRVEKRNVVITFDLNPNPALGETVAGLRELLYKSFADPSVDADSIKLGLHDDQGRVRYVVGYTETFDGDIFSSETSTQISIICPDPYIRDDVPTVLTHPTGWTTVPFTYAGTAETGFEVLIYVNTATNTVTLDNNGKKMVLNRTFAAGDIIRISTVPGSRFVGVTTAPAAEAPILGSLTPGSPWPQLHSQSNVMKVYGAAPTDLIAAIRSLTYTQSYWGI